MNEKQLRALVREEIEVVLDEESHIDSHLKFRKLVERRLGTDLDESTYDTTFQAWSDAVQESAGQDIEGEVLEHYLNEALDKILGL
jgi:hypothetical protein